MKKVLIVICCAAMLVAFSPVFAQNAGKIEAGDLGFNFFTGVASLGEDLSLDGSFQVYGIGLVYHPASFLSIEPGVLFSRRSEEDINWAATPDSKHTQDSTSYGVSLGLFYIREINTGLYLYAGPRIYYTRSEESEESKGSWNNRTESESDTIQLSLLIGFKYLFNDHVGIFADMGLSFNSYERKYKSWDTVTGVISSDTETTEKTISLSRAVIGIVFYL